MNSEIIHVRFAEKDDADLIATLSRKTFYESFAADNNPEDMEKFLTERFTHEALMAEVGSPGNVFLIAHIGAIPAGYVRLRNGEVPPELKAAYPIELARIYAATEYIGKGVGSSLMKKSIEFAKEKNHDVIWLGVWKTNQRAIDFYSRWGFEIFSEQDFLLGNDLQRDWLMCKKIGDERIIP